MAKVYDVRGRLHISRPSLYSLTDCHFTHEHRIPWFSWRDHQSVDCPHLGFHPRQPKYVRRRFWCCQRPVSPSSFGVWSSHLFKCLHLQRILRPSVYISQCWKFHHQHRPPSTKGRMRVQKHHHLRVRVRLKLRIHVAFSHFETTIDPVGHLADHQ